jgi:choline-sulfatase
MRTCAALLAIAMAVAAACGRSAADRERAAPRPNILLVTIDTFRADRLGIGVTPALDRLAASGIRFTNARTAVPLTLPSHATILTGLLPTAHGVRENGLDGLSVAHPTLGRLLKDAGYRTAAFVGAFVLDRRFGLAQGFDTYDDRIPRDARATDRLEAERPASAVIDAALAWLDQSPATSPQPPATSNQPPATSNQQPAPFFVWIHLYDPHAPYEPPAEFRARAKSAYDGEIAYADSQISRVFSWLHDRGLIGDTTIVVAGDHGEGLGDHGERTHGMLLYDSTLRVPLMVSGPGIAGATRDEAVSLVDIAPTILRAAGVNVPGEMKGRNLLAAAGNGAEIYAETEYPRVAGWSPLQTLTDGRWMAIRASNATELYDLRNDPREEHDMGSAQTATATAMAARIDAIRASSVAEAEAARRAERGAGSPEKPDRGAGAARESNDRLRALGYVASSVQPTVGSDAPNPARTIERWNQFEEALSLLNDRPAAAVPILSRLAAENREGPVFQTTYARALKETGQIKAALAAYREAARRWPTDATLLHDLAVAAREAGALDEARRADEAALAIAPESPTAHNGAGLVAVDQHRPADAVREFERATALDPTNASYWTNLGNARREVRDAAGAEQAYRRALDLDARGSDAANGLGVLLVEAHRPAEAVPWLERAVGAAPDFVEARLNLGIALQQSGHIDRAASVYRDVLHAPARFARERQAAAALLASLGAVR